MHQFEEVKNCLVTECRPYSEDPVHPLCQNIGPEYLFLLLCDNVCFFMGTGSYVYPQPKGGFVVDLHKWWRHFVACLAHKMVVVCNPLTL